DGTTPERRTHSRTSHDDPRTPPCEGRPPRAPVAARQGRLHEPRGPRGADRVAPREARAVRAEPVRTAGRRGGPIDAPGGRRLPRERSEEHTSELKSR